MHAPQTNFYTYTYIELGLEHRLKPFIMSKGLRSLSSTYCGLQHKEIRLKTSGWM